MKTFEEIVLSIAPFDIDPVEFRKEWIGRISFKHTKDIWDICKVVHDQAVDLCVKHLKYQTGVTENDEEEIWDMMELNIQEESILKVKNMLNNEK